MRLHRWLIPAACLVSVCVAVPGTAEENDENGPAYDNPETLVEIISGDDPEARLAALDHATDAGVDAIPLLAPLLGDADPAIARLALRAMERITHHSIRPDADEDGRQEAAAALTDALGAHEEDNAVRREVIYLLGVCGCEAEAVALREYIDAPELRDETLQALTRIPSEAATQTLLDALDEADEADTRAIISALAQRADSSAEPRLRQFVNHSNEAIATAAVHALARIGEPPRASEPNVRTGDLVTALLRAAYEQGEAGRRQRAESIYSVVISMQPARFQLAAVLRGLARIDSEQTVTHAMPHILDPGLAHTVVDALSNLDAPNVDERLASAFQVVNAPTQAAVLTILHRRESAAFEELAAEALDSEDAEARFAAKTLLGETVDIDTARRTAEEGSHLHRGAAWDVYVERLKRMADNDDADEALGRLARAARNEQLDLSARLNAIEVIAGLGGGGVGSILEDLIDDESVDAAIRERAEEALADLNEREQE